MQRMYFVLLFQHILKRRIYHTVPCYDRLAGELRRHDIEPVMPTATVCANMQGMLVAVIGDLDLSGLQHSQVHTHLLYAAHAGETFLKGLTVTCAYTPAAT